MRSIFTRRPPRNTSKISRRVGCGVDLPRGHAALIFQTGGRAAMAASRDFAYDSAAVVDAFEDFLTFYDIATGLCRRDALGLDIRPPT